MASRSKNVQFGIVYGVCGLLVGALIGGITGGLVGILFVGTDLGGLILSYFMVLGGAALGGLAGTVGGIALAIRTLRRERDEHYAGIRKPSALPQG